MGEVKLGLGKAPYLDSLYIDEPRVWIHFQDSSTQEGWDFGTSGSSPIPFDPSVGGPHLELVGYARRLSWIEDTITGKRVFQFHGRYAEPLDIQWDGQYLVAGYYSGEVLILDFSHVLSRD